MTRTIRLAIGGIFLFISIILLANGVIWYISWGAAISMLLWGAIGDTSTPENKPKSIKQSYKNQVSGDLKKASEIILALHELQEPWKSKNCPNKLQQKIQSMKNMATASITYTYGESLITKLKLSITKSKETYMVTVVGEGQESIDFINEKLGTI